MNRRTWSWKKRYKPVKTVYPQLSEDPLGLFGRSEPTEFGRWVQWTSVLMAGVLDGGFRECNCYINSCMLSITGRIRATHRERGTRWSARDRRPFLPAR